MAKSDYQLRREARRSALSSGIATRLKKEEEDAKNNKWLDVLGTGGTLAEGQPEEENGFWKGVQDVSKTVFDSATESYRRLGEGSAEVLNEVTGGAERERQANTKRQEDDLATIKSLGEKIKSSTDEAQKEKYRTALRAIAKTSDEQDATFSGTQAQIAERTDPLKAAGAAAEVGLDIITAGQISPWLKGAKATLKTGEAAMQTGKLFKSSKSVAKTGIDILAKKGSKETAKKVAKSTGSGALIGTGYGLAGTLEDKGGEATTADYITNGAIGGTIGGVLGGTGSAIGTKISNRSANKAAARASQAASDDVAGVGDGITDDLMRTAKEVNLTDPNLSKEDKLAALASGNDTLGGNKLDVTPQAQKALRSISDTPEAIQKELDDLYAGNYTDDLYDVSTVDGAVYSVQDATKATERQIELLARQRDDLLKQVDTDGVGSEAAMGRVSDIEEQIARLQEGDSKALTQIFGEGASKDINPQRLRERVKDLTSRRELATKQAIADKELLEKTTFKSSGRSSDEIASELDGTRAGKPTDDIMSDAPDFKNIDDVARGLPQLQDRVLDISVRKDNVLKQMETVASPDTANAMKSDIDIKYDKQRQALDGMSPQRQKYELSKINDAHTQELASIDEMADANADGYNKLKSELDAIAREERDLVLRANYVKSENSDRFRVIDPTKQEQKIQTLEKEKVLLDTYPDPEDTSSVIVNAAKTSASPEEFTAKIFNDEAVKKAYDQKVASAQSLAFKTTRPGFNPVGTPTKILRDAGPRGAAIADEIENAHFDYALARGQFHENYTKWSQALKGSGKGADTRVFKSLDGENVKLNSIEQRVATDIRKYLDDKAIQLGLTDKMKVKDYIPHMFEQSFGRNYNDLEKIAAKIRYGVDEAGKKITKDEKDALAKSISNVDSESLAFIRSNNSWRVKNGFLEQRTNKEGYTEDLFKVLSSYDNIANKKVYYEPALRFASAASEGMNREFQEYLVKFSEKIKGDNSSIFEHTMDKMLGQGNTARVLSTERRLSNASIMGMSPLTWVKNLQDISKVFADRDVDEFVKAIPFALKAMRYGTAENKMLFKHGIMESTQSNFLRGMSLDQKTAKELGIKGMAKKATLKTEQVLWAGMRASDAFTRAVNYQAAIGEFSKKSPEFANLVNRNMDELTGAEKALYDKGMKYVLGTNRDTAFTFSDIDIPVGLNNSLGRSTLNMQTYNLQTAKYIKKTFGDVLEKTDNGYKLSTKGLVKLSKYVAANAAFMTTIGSALGLRPWEMVPFGNEAANGNLPQSPIIGQLIGNEFQKGLIPTAGNLVSEGFKAATGQDNALEEAVGESGQAGLDFLTSHIPGKTQFSRTAGGIQSVESGQARSTKGNIQFNQDADPLNAFMATVFGKNTTDAGKEWKAEGSKTLSPEQMRIGQDKDSGVDMNQLSPEMRAMYTDFYNSVNNANPYNFDKETTKRQETTSKAKKFIKEANGNGAFRLVEDYNNKAKEQIQRFVKKYGAGELPPEIINQMQKQFIDYEDLIDE